LWLLLLRLLWSGLLGRTVLLLSYRLLLLLLHLLLLLLFQDPL
jgi:hypothetical protein